MGGGPTVAAGVDAAHRASASGRIASSQLLDHGSLGANPDWTYIWDLELF